MSGRLTETADTTSVKFNGGTAGKAVIELEEKVKDDEQEKAEAFRKGLQRSWEKISREEYDEDVNALAKAREELTRLRSECEGHLNKWGSDNVSTFQVRQTDGGLYMTATVIESRVQSYVGRQERYGLQILEEGRLVRLERGQHVQLFKVQ